MEKDVSLSPETFRKHVDVCLTYINCALKQLSRLFLVEDLVDSLKVSSFEWGRKLLGSLPPCGLFMMCMFAKDGKIQHMIAFNYIELLLFAYIATLTEICNTHPVCMSEMCW